MLETLQTFKIVSIIDPALTKVAGDVVIKYGQRRNIADIEPFFDNANPPTIYHARRITRSIWNRVVMTQTTDDLKAQACFQYGVVKVDGLHTEDGVRISFEPTGSVSSADGELKYIKDEEMNRFYPDEMIEIGGVIFRKCFFRPTIDVIYRPQPILVEQWGRLEVLSVVANQTIPDQNKNERLDLPTQPVKEIDQTKEKKGKK